MGVDHWRAGGRSVASWQAFAQSYDGLHAARRGTYRILYKIDEDKHAVEIRSIRYRADAYRT
jgi:mRNA-degrading endonuclease RelE of RelBE toxin-antitoxin system